MTLPKEVREELGIKTPAKIFFDFDWQKKALLFKSYPDITKLAGIVGKKSKTKIKDVTKLRDWTETHYRRY